MSAVAFDNTMLSILFNPNNNSTIDLAKERAESVVRLLEKARRKIILPAPACAELLTAIGPSAQEYINIVGRTRLFEVASFDARCAAELAILNRDTFHLHDKRDKLAPYQKIKFDRQIIAICKVYGATEIYTDDNALGKRARLCSIVPIGISDIPIPDSEKQTRLDLEPSEDIPDAENENAA